MTATTLGAQRSGLTNLGRSGGDAQERAATNPVAALPCAWTPLLLPLLIPSSLTVGVTLRARVLFGLVRGIDPGRSRAKTARDRPGSVGKLELWRATQSRLHAGAVVSGRPPTNPVGGLPAGSRGHRRRPGHGGGSHG